jgi:hypothetical protein
VSSHSIWMCKRPTPAGTARPAQRALARCGLPACNQTKIAAAVSFKSWCQTSRQHATVHASTSTSASTADVILPRWHRQKLARCCHCPLDPDSCRPRLTVVATMHTPLGDLAPPLLSYARSALRTDAFVIRQPAQTASHASLSDPFERSCTSLALSYACITIEDIKTIAPTSKQPGP